MSIRATAKCRYSAANRLKSQNNITFFATTFLSLGLILIPLLQNSKIKLGFPDSVLNMMQIFMAVAVLVYSVTIAKSSYDVRAEKLTECGDNLKELGREVDDSIEKNTADSGFDLSEFRKKYSEILSTSENHLPIDYAIAILDMPNDYNNTWVENLWLHTKVALYRVKNHWGIPSLLLIFEISFIAEMLGITKFYPNALRTTLG